MRRSRATVPVGLAVLLLAALPPTAAAEGSASPLASPTTLPLAAVAWGPDGAIALAVGGSPGSGVVVRLDAAGAAVAWQGPQRLHAVAWSPSGPALVAGDAGLLRTRDGVTFDAVPLPEGASPLDARAIAWKPDGTQALVAGRALLRYWAANQTLEVLRQAADERFGAVAWRPDGALALVEQARRENGAWTTGRLLTYDGAALTHVATYGTGAGLVEGILWAGSGAWALVYGFDGGTATGPVLRWDGAQLGTLHTKAVDRFTGMAWRPGGTKALVTGLGAAPRLAETDGSSLLALADPGVDLLGLAWHPQGQRALLVGAGGALLEWLPEGRPELRFAAPFSGAVLSGASEVAVRAVPRAGHPLQAVELRVDGRAWQPLAPGPQTDLWTLTLDTRPLGDGQHVLEARARDDGAASLPVSVGVRVLNGLPEAPRFEAPPAEDADGLLPLVWSDTGADRYEVQDSADASFAQPTLAAATGEPGASVLLRTAGEHHLRVRGLVGTAASPWSEPAVVRVTLTASPFAPGADDGGGPAQGTPQAPGTGGPPGAPAAPRATPGLEAAFALTAALAAGLALRRRR